MEIIRMIITIIGLLCIFLGLLTPLSSILFTGIGMALILISAVFLKLFK